MNQLAPLPYDGVREQKRGGTLVSLSATVPPCPLEVPEGRYRAYAPLFVAQCARSRGAGPWPIWPPGPQCYHRGLGGLERPEGAAWLGVTVLSAARAVAGGVSRA